MRIQNIRNYTFFKGNYAQINHVGSIAYDSRWHKNSTIERTLGQTHSNATGQVYFANPLENISSETKTKADYIIYDNEPNIPNLNDVKENYFGKKRIDYGLEYQELTDYYARREVSGNSDSNWDKHLRNVAEECRDTYNEGMNYRYQKETSEDQINNLNKDKQELISKLNHSKQELESQKNIKKQIIEHIGNLNTNNKNAIRKNEQKIFDYANKKLAENDGINLNYTKSRNTQTIYNELVKIHKEKSTNKIKLDNAIVQYNKIKTDCTDMIKDIGQYIANLENNLDLINKKIAEKESIIEKCKSKLTPLFDKLLGIYSYHKIKPIKRFYF